MEVCLQVEFRDIAKGRRQKAEGRSLLLIRGHFSR
jgi:hypothetical protein